MLTGHRPGERLNEIESLRGMVSLLTSVRGQHEGLQVVSGGALGADYLWACAAHSLNIPFEVFVPYGYEQHYGLGHEFFQMLDAAQKVHRVGSPTASFHWKLNFQRNEVMVNEADLHVICSDVHPKELVKEKRGGTRHAAELILNNGPYFWINSLKGSWEFNSPGVQERLALP
jgi:hypothetical protein